MNYLKFVFLFAFACLDHANLGWWDLCALSSAFIIAAKDAVQNVVNATAKDAVQNVVNAMKSKKQFLKKMLGYVLQQSKYASFASISKLV